MKKKLIITLAVFVFIVIGCIVWAEGNQDGASKNTSASKQTANQSANVIPVPTLTHFNERSTIAKWAARWDRPDIPCFVYLFSYGNCIGYFISNGKPASTQSYLTPETTYYSGNGGTYELPDIDGCYGTNNPGIRFFTASGSAVEAAGFQYLYSDTKLELNVPELKFSK